MSELHKDFVELKGRFVDVTGVPARDNDLWPPIIVTKEEIDAEIARIGIGRLPKVDLHRLVLGFDTNRPIRFHLPSELG